MKNMRRLVVFSFAAFYFFGAVPTWAGSLNLAWDPNTESDLAGYRLYYGTSSFLSPSSVWYTLAEVKANPQIQSMDIADTLLGITVTGLTNGTTYYFRLSAFDDAANESLLNVDAGGLDTQVSSTPATTTDSVPPVISAVNPSGITDSAATITWTTNEAATTQVEYGLTASYGSATTLNGAYATAHSQGLTGLSAETVYHYRVLSRDTSGNLATSADRTFTTRAPGATDDAGTVTLRGNLFNPEAGEEMKIKIASQEGSSHARIYDLGGTLVRDLGEAAVVTTDNPTFTWDGKDDAGGIVRDGAYLCEVRFPGGRVVKKAAVRKR